MTEREAYVAFNLTDRVGSVKVVELVSRYGSVVAAWEDYPSKVSRTGDEIDWREEFRKAEKYKVDIVTPADPGYPARLLEIPGHPLALYVKGDVKALSLPSVAIVGTRRATSYGIDHAQRFAFDLAGAGWMVLSGLALGIDAAAHRGALDAGGVTVGILGSGLDRFYPEENRELAREIVAKGGAVVSEFPFGRPPDQQTFPIRNHVVAGLSTGLVAIEAPVKSGTLITTSIAADLGRTVMALPGRVDNRMSAGCLNLIREGATLVRNASDVMEALSRLIAVPLSPVKKPDGDEADDLDASPPVLPSVSVEEAQIMRHVDAEGLSLDELARLSELPFAKVNSLCMALRIKGRLRFLPGNRVALPRPLPS